MTDLQTAAVIVFWTCIGLVVYAYAVYPLVIALAAALRRPPPPPTTTTTPTVSLVIAAYNEEAAIAETLQNALAVDYPPDKFEILVGSDGSTDATAAIVRNVADRRVRLLDFDRNRGKASVLNDALAAATGSIALLSDANTRIDPNAVRSLVRWFDDPDIGAAVGRLVLTDPDTGRNADSLYWRYETLLKRCEGRLGALLGANGALYALRRDLYTPIPPDTIVDDFVIPLRAKLRTGCAIVYDPEALAFEETPPDVGSEFRRRARIGAGGFQAIGTLWKLLHPRYGWTAFAFFSHKVLRWLGPFFLIGALAANVLLWNHTPYGALLLGQAVFYTLSVVLAYVPPRYRFLKPLRLTTMFTSMNAALLVGFVRYITGRQKGTWRRTTRGNKPGFDESRQ
jgi:cellulose synthase/poly-beta-1,6-N-acetylglucosamine synthase-like glycosyltransferase